MTCAIALGGAAPAVAADREALGAVARALHDGDRAGAVARLEALLEQEPEDPTLLRLLAAARRDGGDPTAARTLLGQACERGDSKACEDFWRGQQCDHGVKVAASGAAGCLLGVEVDTALTLVALPSGTKVLPAAALVPLAREQPTEAATTIASCVAQGSISLWTADLTAGWMPGSTKGVGYGAGLLCAMRGGGVVGRVDVGGATGYGDAGTLFRAEAGLGYLFAGTLGINVRANASVLTDDRGALWFVPLSVGVSPEAAPGALTGTIELAVGPLVYASGAGDATVEGWALTFGGGVGVGFW